MKKNLIMPVVDRVQIKYAEKPPVKLKGSPSPVREVKKIEPITIVNRDLSMVVNL